jgi:uncharacterized membrane-anchored protein
MIISALSLNVIDLAVKSILGRALLCLCLVLQLGSALADPASDKATQEAQISVLMKESENRFVYGPATVDLGAQGSMRLQRGQAFMPPDVALKIFAATGIKTVPDLIGVVIPGLPGDEVPTDDWGMVAVFFRPLGFVRDDDANGWDHGKMLDAQRKGIEERNAEAREKGLPEKELNGWVEAPRYEYAGHRLLWATSSQEKGKPETALALYGAAALGREGIMIFAFGTEAAKLSERKGLANDLLSGIQFKEGKRYQDYAEGTDKVAEIGLAALVGGVAAKKLGIFAMLAVLLAKWGKLIALGVGGLAIFKLRKKKADSANS